MKADWILFLPKLFLKNDDHILCQMENLRAFLPWNILDVPISSSPLFRLNSGSSQDSFPGVIANEPSFSTKKLSFFYCTSALLLFSIKSFWNVSYLARDDKKELWSRSLLNFWIVLWLLSFLLLKWASLPCLLYFSHFNSLQTITPKSLDFIIVPTPFLNFRP